MLNGRFDHGKRGQTFTAGQNLAGHHRQKAPCRKKSDKTESNAGNDGKKEEIAIKGGEEDE
jgi:hypothetical protein